MPLLPPVTNAILPPRSCISFGFLTSWLPIKLRASGLPRQGKYRVTAVAFAVRLVAMRQRATDYARYGL